MDMSFVARQLVDEMRAAHPERPFTVAASGDTEGKWDRPRIGQVFSNYLATPFSTVLEIFLSMYP